MNGSDHRAAFTRKEMSNEKSKHNQSPWITEKAAAPRASHCSTIFERELQNEIPRPHPHFRFVREYHDRCDAYDAEACPPDGMPRTNEAHTAVNRNAKVVILDIANRMFVEGLGSSVYACEMLLREAIRVIPYKSNS